MKRNIKAVKRNITITFFLELITKQVAELTILLDPRADENCQFEAIYHQLSLICMYRDVSTLRHEAVDYLRDNQQFYQLVVHNTPVD